MDTQQIKNLVVDKIMQIEDPGFLQAINTILDHNSFGSSVYELSIKEKERIESGLTQLDGGQFKLNSDLEADENKWLNE